MIYIISRHITTLAQAAPQLKDQVLSTQRDALLQQDFLATAKRLGVHINPRYGSWDPAHLAVTGATTTSPFLAN